MAKQTAITSGKGEIILYRAPDGRAALDVRFEEDTLWLTQKQIAELFATERSVITKHLRNIFNSGELDEKRNVQKMYISKRIGAALFLWFLEKNGRLYRDDGTKRIADNALVAMTLLIAESQPADKSIITSMIVNLINAKN